MNLLFLCVANSARSQMAEGLGRKILAEPGRVASAGSMPASVNPLAVKVMREIGIDISQHRSKCVSEFNAAEFDYVVTLCADEVCPVLPGNVTRVHWPLPDPASVDRASDPEGALRAFRKVRDELERRITALLCSTS